MLVGVDQETAMDVIEFLNYLLGGVPTRQLGVQLAEVYDNASRRCAATPTASR